MESKFVLKEVKDGVGYLTINNPEKLNALSSEISDSIKDSLYEFSDDPNVRAVVLRGSNHTFCGGGDVKSMKVKIDTNTTETRPGLRKYKELIVALRNCQKPVIGCLEGAVAGGGVSMGLACDYVIIEKTAKCVFAFVNIGFIPDMGSTTLLTSTISKAKATELLMLGERFTGEQAVEWGMFNKAVDKENMEEELAKIVKKFANGPTMAYARMKNLMNKACYKDMEKNIDLEGEYQYQLCKTHDHADAINAFFEKRRPNFLGK